MTNHELARQAAEAVDAAVDFPLMNHDRLLDSATWIGVESISGKATIGQLRTLARLLRGGV